MIDPSKAAGGLPVSVLPMFVFKRGFHARTGVMARADGILDPVVIADRLAVGRHGWNGLAFHEILHCLERHSFVGLLVLTIPTSCAWPLAFFSGSLVAGYLLALWGVLAWVWWRREQEVRADAFAWRGAGAQDFYAFVLELPLAPEGRLPAGWTWLARPRAIASAVSRLWCRWLYAKSLTHRINRASRRAERTKWTPPSFPLSESRSSEPTAASSSRTPPPATGPRAPGPTGASRSSKASTGPTT